ncbi:hypothetical protein [Kitasatospora sp. CB01950]|uniref:hypothetical protein n=1 Tax=Kitasatospora sp. CB01950 TaxID=1703930 RepID=UPI00093D5AB7|nr:hypothetical protein [Kitasatospora sp. CB01950]OKJ06819.1 hypothetical protein AMK19_23495 [Kitasatospora sp. CB01950]
MATLLRGEAPAVLQAAEHAQYQGAYRPPGIPLAEVRRGPYDGTRGAVHRGANGELPKLLPLANGRIVYEYDRTGPDGIAIYRYSPRLSPAHRGLMDGIAEVYAEHKLMKGQG